MCFCVGGVAWCVGGVLLARVVGAYLFFYVCWWCGVPVVAGCCGAAPYLFFSSTLGGGVLSVGGGVLYLFRLSLSLSRRCAVVVSFYVSFYVGFCVGFCGFLFLSLLAPLSAPLLSISMTIKNVI